ncbi:MAG: hypothetical protein NZ703_13785 [Gemmataceae bacterium]|nr:hypothetical protein [Gemmataceae bacterium]
MLDVLEGGAELKAEAVPEAEGLLPPGVTAGEAPGSAHVGHIPPAIPAATMAIPATHPACLRMRWFLLHDI